MIIDATNQILGRMATFVAKKALLGEKIQIINCEKAVVTGNKEDIFARYKQKRNRGIPLRGPYYPRSPDAIVRRTIRGMLPFKRTRGRTAYRNVLCYKSVPEELQGKKAEHVKDANINKVPNLKYTTIEKICKRIGPK